MISFRLSIKSAQKLVFASRFNLFKNKKKMERILRGIIRYRHTTREQMVKEFKQVKDNPQV